MKQAKKRLKAEDKLQAEDRKRAERLAKKHPELNIDVEAYVRQEAAKRAPRPQMPPQLEERQQFMPPPRPWEEGAVLEGGYQRKSTIEVERIEAHLDSLAERETQLSVADKYKKMFGEDLPIPEGYELIPERRVRRRSMGPTGEEPGTEAEGAPSPEAVAQAYGGAPPPAPVAMSAPPAPPMIQVTVAAPAQEAAAPAAEAPVPAPEAPAWQPAPAEATTATEVVVEASVPVAAPALAPVAAAPAAPQPSGIAGAPAAVAAAATVTAAPAKEEVPLKLRPFLDLRRLYKIGPRAAARGGPIVKLILGIINFFIYVALLLIFLLPVWVTIYYVWKDMKARRAEEIKRAQEYAERYGPPEGYGPEGYYDEGAAYDYGPEGGYAPEGYGAEAYPAEEAYPEEPYPARDYRGAGGSRYKDEYQEEEGYGY